MIQAWLLKLHRWVALLFALPLLFVLGTGLVLAFEPWIVVRAIQPAALTVDKVQALLARHDASGQVRSMTYRSYDDTLTLSAGRRGGTVIDVRTGEALPEPSAMARTLQTMRRMHEALLIDAGWLVIACSGAMLALSLLGILMGWPRFANSVSGWHKGMAWGLLPLIILSPLTGIFLAAGITFAPAPSRPSGPPEGGALSLQDAVRVVGQHHDLSGLVWLRTQGGRLVARIVEGGEYRTFAVTRDGTTALPRNWPRIWHEGNFAGIWSAAMNVIISVAMLGLLVSGVWIWSRRQLRRRRNRLQRVAAR